tara:strand:- start:11009 stop:11989 length:981 start_codon:yes stop_codon:yes gene_type:complete
MNQGLTVKTIGIGALAGATTALLCLGLASGSMLAVLLFFISPVPLMVAGLGFGLSAAVTGAIVAIAANYVFANVFVATLVALAISAPACATSYWLNLARPADEVGGPEGQLAWYPLADVLFANALFTALAFVVLGAMIGFGPELAGELATRFVARLQEINPEATLSPDAVGNLRDFMLTVVPVAQPFSWMLTLTLSIYIATAIARRSGLMKRPRDDWPRALRLPRPAIIAFMAAVLLGFVSGGIGHAASAFSGALGAGLAMAGLAMLHARTRGMAVRAGILVLAYVAILVISPLILVSITAGMFGAGRHFPLSPSGPNKSDLNRTH